MSLTTLNKQPAELMDYDVIFDDWMTPTDSIVNAAVTISSPDLLNPTTTISDTRVKLWLSAGLDGQTYKVTTTITTNDGRIKQAEFKLKVKDT